MQTIHAHIETQSRDCDGTYDHDYVARPADEDDYAFRYRVLSNIVSAYALHATLTVAGDTLSWNEDTEEGYSATEARFCWDDCTENGTVNYRDHTAEAAGY